MKIDLPAYIKNYASKEITFESVSDIVEFNKLDTTIRVPYGQARFEGILDVDLSQEELEQLKEKLHAEALKFFETPMNAHQLDAVLSINNWNAGYAAAAFYPCLTLPMGYKTNGEPVGLTFIAKPFEEDNLLKMAFAFEQATKARKSPEGYK